MIMDIAGRSANVESIENMSQNGNVTQIGSAVLGLKTLNL